MPTYFINTDAAVGRRAFMEAQFAKLQMSATRIAAVTPDTLPARTNPGRDLSLGELCCTLSHLEAMRRFLKTGARHALILEDDAVLSPALPKFLEAYMASVLPIDVVRIETFMEDLRMDRSGPEVGGVELLRLFTRPGGTAGYIVSRRGAEIVLNTSEMTKAPFDRALYDPYRRAAKRLRVRQAFPALCIQDQRRSGNPEHPSDLHPNGHGSTERPSRMRDVEEHLRRDIIGAPHRLWNQFRHGTTKRNVPFLASPAE
jgi:glycosyl transferase family 25